MTAADLTARSSDNANDSIMLVDDTVNALTELLQGIQLSEERAAQIIGAVRAITSDADLNLCLDATLSDPAETAADPQSAVTDSGDAFPMPSQSEVSPTIPKVPSGHRVVMHGNTKFVLPLEGEPEPFYLITKGKMVGMIANWEIASPMVGRVSGAVFRRMQSGTTVSQACQIVENAIDDGVVSVVGKMPSRV